MTLRGLTPRDPQESLMLGGYLWLFPAFYLTAKLGVDVAAVLGVVGESRPIAHIVVDAVLAAVCLGCVAAFRNMPVEWADRVVFPFVVVAILLLTGGNLSSGEASAGAQMFYLIPTAYAAYTLRAQGAWIVLGLLAVCMTLNSALISPHKLAVLDSVFMIAIASLTMFATQSVRNRSEAAHDALVQQAQTDPLTGVKTRQVLDSALLAAIESDAQGTVLFIVDCDNFKHINDAFGHPVGDQALRHLTSVLETFQPDQSLVFRIGGDELAVLAYQCDYPRAQELARNIVEVVAKSSLCTSTGEEVELSVSVGVAHFPRHAQDVEQLYLVADAALYAAKRGGRGRAGFPEELSSAQEPSARPLEKGQWPSA